MARSARICISILVLAILTSCSARDSIIYNRTTAMRQMELDPRKKGEHRKLDTGVYFIVERTANPLFDTNKVLSNKLLLRAAKLTLKKKFTRFVIFQDAKGDDELVEAMERKRVRKLYLQRIKEKSPLINKMRVLVKKQHGLPVRNEMFAVIVMLNNGKAGLPAKKVKYVIETKRSHISPSEFQPDTSLQAMEQKLRESTRMLDLLTNPPPVR